MPEFTVQAGSTKVILGRDLFLEVRTVIRPRTIETRIEEGYGNRVPPTTTLNLVTTRITPLDRKNFQR